MVLNDIIEQAAGRQSRTPEQGGNVESPNPPLILLLFFQSSITLYHRCVSIVWWASCPFWCTPLLRILVQFSPIDIQCWRFLSERLVYSRSIPLYVHVYISVLFFSYYLIPFYNSIQQQKKAEKNRTKRSNNYFSILYIIDYINATSVTMHGAIPIGPDKFYFITLIVAERGE